MDNITSSLGNDTVSGDGGDDIIRTGVGNDTISGGTGNNSIDGGAGIDNLTYVERTEDITINLSEGANSDGFYTANVGSDYIDLLRAIENIILGSGDDNVRGSLVDNVLQGRDGNDILDGALGNDTLLGGDGNDILKSGFGNNIIDGNQGTDRLQYAQSETNIVTDLTSIDSDGYFSVTNGAYTDKVKNISILEGSHFNDTIKGDANNHSYYGLDGDDVIDGGAGLDIIDGGDGTDTATYVSLTSAVSVAGNVVTDADSNAETLASIEKIFGTNLGDTFVGTTGDEDYSGLQGNDTFSGTLGNDIIDGGAGTDHITYAALGVGVSFDLITETVTSLVGSSLTTNFSNIETLTGSSATNDVIDYTASTDDITINLAAGTTAVAGDTDYNVSAIENAETGTGADSFTGDSAGNSFVGGDGNDIFYASAGADSIDGGDGSDTFYINTSAAGTVNLASETLSGFASEDIQSDTIASIENLVQTGTGNVTVVGGVDDNTITTSDGTDIISAGAGADVISTGAGNDTVYMGSGDDTVNLGAGNDTVTYADGNNDIDGGTGTDHFDVSGFSTALTIDLSTVDGDGYATIVTSGGVTRLRNIEDLTTTVQDDIITGDANANDIDAGDGDDRIDGGAGLDTIDGGDGDDRIDGGAGLDTIDGGDGTDTATYLSASAAVTVSGDSVTDADSNVENLVNIETIEGTIYNDSFTGTSGVNHYMGNAGSDNFIASLGSDLLEGGDGTDTIDFSTGATNVSLSIDLSGAGNKVATGTSVNTSFNRIENIIGSSQTDTVTYAGSSSDVTVNLQTGAATGLSGDADYTLSSIENVTGGSGDDRITADNGTNVLDGGAGTSDTLVSSTDQSGTMNLSIIGSNQISGYSGGDNELTRDTVQNFENFEHTGTGVQNVTGSSAVNIIRTGSGNDTIEGAGGADTIDGNYANAQRAEDYVFEDFEGGTADDWTTTYGSVIETKTVETSEPNFTNFLGRSGEISNSNETIFRTYDVTGTKDHAVLEFDFYEIDSWDYERMNFYINDTLVFQEIMQGGAEQEFVRRGQVTIDGMTVHYIYSPDTNLTDLGFAGHADQKHKVYMIIDNPESEIKFSTLAYLSNGHSNESYGIDNVKFYSTNNLLGTDDGIDTASYASDTVGVTVNLETETGSGTGSHADGDTILNIDNVIGGSGDDIITTKNYAVNDIDAGAGDDRVIASIGTGDVLDGGANGAGGDTLVVRNTRGTIVDLSTNTVTYAEYGDDLFGDTFSNFENYESSAFTHEKIIGTSGANVITTGQHNDYLEGGAGNDTLDGGDGSGDWVSYENDTGTVTANLSTGTASATISGTDTLSNIENIRTGSGADNITGGTNVNTIDGGGGNDIVASGDGNDVISGKAGQDNLSGDANNDYISGGQDVDTIFGGDGNDTISGDATYLNGLTHFYALDEGVGSTLSNQGTAGGTLTQGWSYDQNGTVSLASGSGLNWEHGSEDGSSYLDFNRYNDNPRPQLPSITLGKEFTISSWMKFDAPHGNQHDFVFRLSIDGNYYIDAYRNNNSNQFRIRFEHNNDHKNYYVDNVAQEEWVHFVYTMDDTGYIRVYMNGVEELGVQYTTDVAASTTYTSNYIGLGQHNNEAPQMDGGLSQFAIHDRALTSNEAVALYTDTKTGLDSFTISAGDDNINGDAGTDNLSGGEGSDTVSGGDGTDTIQQLGDQTVDHTNILSGNDGNDTIYVRAANNNIDGGNDTDTLSYNYFVGYTEENLTIDLSTGASYQGTVDDGTYTDNFQNIETIHGGRGSDTFIGDAGNNVFYGNDGGDNFYGAGGSDTFYGGDDTDTANYATAGSAVTADLETSTSGSDIIGSALNDGDGGIDTLQNIENITGSNFDDTFTGSSVANLIQSGSGNDTIYASEGADTINGGTHTTADILDYTNFTQDETVTISSSSISGNTTGTDTYLGIEQVNLGSGADSLTGSATDVFANTIDFDFGADSDTVEIASGAISNNIVDIADDFSNIETLDISGATGSSTITGDDVADLTDSGNNLRLDIGSGFGLTVASGSNYALTGSVDNGTHTTYSFQFGVQNAELDVYTV